MDDKLAIFYASRYAAVHFEYGAVSSPLSCFHLFLLKLIGSIDFILASMSLDDLMAVR